MNLYDNVIKETEKFLESSALKIIPYDSSRVWKDVGKSELIMQRDAAFELGGSGKDSANYTCVTSSGKVKEDEVWVCGPDLAEIHGDVSFARIVILEVGDIGEDEEAFAAIRNLDFVRYHVFPAGYMVRVSSVSREERVRVAKRIVERGASLSYIGNTYIKKYRAVPGVRHVRVIFVTDSDKVGEFGALAEKVDAITKTLTHILDGLPTDCGHCSMKQVCDEVEGMKELHMNQKRKV